MKYENELEIDLGRCFRALVKKWWFMLALGMLFAVAGFVLTLDKKPDMYSATSSVYGMSSEAYSVTQAGVKAMNDYKNIATSMKVSERAALLMGKNDLSGEDVQKATTVSTGEESSKSSVAVATTSAILIFTCKYEDPVTAMEMANAVAEAFVIEMQSILGTDAVQVLDKPYTYKQYFDATKNQWMTRIVAFLAGIVLAAAIIVFGEIFDNKASTIRECTLREEIPVFGVIPRYKD